MYWISYLLLEPPPEPELPAPPPKPVVPPNVVPPDVVPPNVVPLVGVPPKAVAPVAIAVLLKLFTLFPGEEGVAVTVYVAMNGERP